MLINFAIRNPSFAVADPRRSYRVVKAMEEFSNKNTFCWHCLSEEKVEVHHLFPVHLFPMIAHMPQYFVPLCRKNDCHRVIGHFGNYSNFNPLCLPLLLDLAVLREAGIDQREIAKAKHVIENIRLVSSSLEGKQTV